MDRTDAMTLLVTTADAGSLSGAARALGLSLASVSRHMTALEERLGTRLVVRTTRKLALTEAGRVYYERAKRILAEIDEVETSLLADAVSPAGRLHVSGPIAFGRVFMLPLLAEFLAAHPRITIDVTLLDRQVNLVEEGIDLAIRIGTMEDSGLIVRKLGSLRWVVSGSPAYLNRRGTPRRISDLSEHDCLVYSQQNTGSAWRLLDRGKQASIRVPVRMRSNTLDGVIAAAIAGTGLVYAPAWQIAEHVAAGKLQVVLRNHGLPPLPINAVLTHNKLLSGKVRALLEFLVENLASKDFDTVPAFGKVGTRRALAARTRK
jgi:DNA-binding transcriptional LysR family regulator